MRRVTILLVAIACIYSIGIKSVHAQSQLEIWCLDQGLNWNVELGYGVCRNEWNPAYVNAQEELTILVTEKLFNEGMIYNYGTITNNGFLFQNAGIFNYNIIDNFNVLQIEGVITNFDQSNINNYGLIGIGANVNGIKNWGAVNNHGEIQTASHADAINNFGVLNNGLDGVIVNQGNIYSGPNSAATNDGIVSNTGFIGLEGKTTNNGVISNSWIIYIKNTVDNYGDLLTSGTLRNDAMVNNLGYINNQGTLINGYFEPTDESGIYNDGVIYNGGTIDNFLALQNEGSILRDACLMSVINEVTPITGSGVIVDLDQCVKLPLVIHG